MAYNVNFVLQPTINSGPFDISGTTYNGVKTLIETEIPKSELLGAGKTLSISDDNITKFDVVSRGSICNDTTVSLPFPKITIESTDNNLEGSLFLLQKLKCGNVVLYDNTVNDRVEITSEKSYTTHTSITGLTTITVEFYGIISTGDFVIYAYGGGSGGGSDVYPLTTSQTSNTINNIISRWDQQIKINIYYAAPI